MQAQTLDALGDCEFAGQATHAPAADAPVAAENVPTPQSRHVMATEDPVTAEYLPTPQSRHVAAPVTILYFPATQPTHVPPLGPVNPRLQRQEPTAVCDASVCPEFDGQV